MRTAIYISGLLFFASFWLILQDDFGQEWKQTQRQFAELDENQYYSSLPEAYSATIALEQIVVEGLSRIDRCPTCHLGINNEKYVQAEQPFSTHPGDLLNFHKTKEFGCTSCHQGQGYSVSYEKAAHEKLEFWNETMLPGELLQASCGTCHLSEEVKEADILTAGRLTIKNRGCTGCHDIGEFYEEENLGPDLGGIGNKVNKAWLFHWLKNPKEYLKNARMPSYRLDDDEILNLTEYLMSLDEKDSPPHPIDPSAFEEGDEDAGKILIGESRCISCHALKGRGGKLAPELERVGDKVRENWLPNFLRNVHYYQLEKKMLEYNFSDQNTIDIAAYIFEEYSDEEYSLPEGLPGSDAPLSSSEKKRRTKAGKKLFAKYGCSGCHSINGQNPPTKVGPKLTNIGNRLESSLEFGDHQDILPTLYNWLFMKLKKPDTFDSTNYMPDFHLSDRESFEVTVALLGNKENRYAQEFLVHEKKESLYKKPGGEFGELFEKYSCITCHSIDKYGGSLSTVPLTMEGSRVKFEWLRDYLILPYAIRPILVERMPRFRMTEREASLMANYIKTVYISDDIPRYFEYEIKPDDAIVGKQIVDSLQCVNCHIINEKGGYLGPQLDNCGDRLEAGWVFSWLLDPLKYKPKTIQPDFGFSDKQARQVTAYLMTKRQDKR